MPGLCTSPAKAGRRSKFLEPRPPSGGLETSPGLQAPAVGGFGALWKENGGGAGEPRKGEILDGSSSQRGEILHPLQTSVHLESSQPSLDRIPFWDEKSENPIVFGRGRGDSCHRVGESVQWIHAESAFNSPAAPPRPPLGPGGLRRGLPRCTRNPPGLRRASLTPEDLLPHEAPEKSFGTEPLAGSDRHWHFFLGSLPSQAARIGVCTNITESSMLYLWWVSWP